MDLYYKQNSQFFYIPHNAFQLPDRGITGNSSQPIESDVAVL